MHNSITSLDLGPRTDVITNTSKEVGINMLLRSMSPRVIATDEIGSESDIKAIKEAAKSGVYLLFTMHGSTIEDLSSKENVAELIKQGYFDNIVILSNRNGVGTIERIYTDLKLKSSNNILGRESVKLW